MVRCQSRIHLRQKGEVLHDLLRHLIISPLRSSLSQESQNSSTNGNGPGCKLVLFRRFSGWKTAGWPVEMRQVTIGFACGGEELRKSKRTIGEFHVTPHSSHPPSASMAIQET
ncbi:hypothetical protein BDV12DRAFT_41123 [Aspergillus spectabilis]